MAGDWPTSTVGAVSKRVTKGTTPTTIGGHFVDTGIAFIKVESITEDGRFDPTKFAFVDDNTNQLLARSVLEENDVLFTIAGTIGRVARVSREVLPANTNQAVAIIRPNAECIEPRFLYYVLRDRERINLAHTRVVQSVQANFSLTELSAIPVPLPSKPEQRTIAHILGTLDDKVELNRRMNETLKELVRATFSAWFLDFTPVRANAEGRCLVGMTPEVAALFPRTFVDSKLGKIPTGWRVDHLADHVTVDRGLSYSGEGLRDDKTGLPMHNLNSIYEGGGYKHEGIKYYEGEYRDKHLLRPGNLIVANTEQGFDHLLIGHAAIVPDCFGESGLFSHHIYRVHPLGSSPLTPYFLAELLNTPRYHYWISGFSNGTTINMLPMDALKMPLLVVPPTELVQRFTSLAISCGARIEANLHQSRIISALRDVLLPKLLSGEMIKGANALQPASF